jgi:hypothetical protein
VRIAEVLQAYQEPGQTVTVRRITGTGPSRRNTDVRCLALVAVGGAMPLVGGVQQSGDQIILTNSEMTAAGWPQPPRHGDQIIYADGQTIVVVQGRAVVRVLEDGLAYILSAIG